MKKNFVITILLVFLVVMNTVLLFMLLKKPTKENRPLRDFITRQLDFSEAQEEEFHAINLEHHRKMRDIEEHSSRLKRHLFAQLGEIDFTAKKMDSVTGLIGNLSTAKEKEVFAYFSAIEAVCTEEQKQKLKSMVSGALRRGPNSRGLDSRGPGPGPGRPQPGGPEPMGPPPPR